MSERLFTDEELAELSADQVQLIKDAIDLGDTDKAKELVDTLYDRFTGLHDGYMIWVSGLLSHIYRNYGGTDAVEAAEREAHTIEANLAPAFKNDGPTDLKSRLISLAKGLQGHVHQPMVVTEDDKTVTITVEPCGSGGRLLAMGGFKPDTGLVRIPEPHNITFQQKDFPIYCVHCPIMGALAYEAAGDLPFVKTFKETQSGSCCEYIFYKDPNDIPERFYTEIGKERPEY